MSASLAALLLLTTGLRQDPKLEQCRKNLLELGKLVPVWIERTKDQNGRGGNERGREFWSAMTRTVPPLIPKERESVLKCPLSGRAYRGPRSEIGGSDKYVACCEPYHSGGAIHALDRNGRVVLVLTPGTPEFREALEQTRGNFASDLDQFFEAELRESSRDAVLPLEASGPEARRSRGPRSPDHRA
jgi:hypothetical protein